jgi:hypothetical protein
MANARRRVLYDAAIAATGILGPLRRASPRTEHPVVQLTRSIRAPLLQVTTSLELPLDAGSYQYRLQNLILLCSLEQRDSQDQERRL